MMMMQTNSIIHIPGRQGIAMFFIEVQKGKIENKVDSVPYVLIYILWPGIVDHMDQSSIRKDLQTPVHICGWCWS